MSRSLFRHHIRGGGAVCPALIVACLLATATAEGQRFSYGTIEDDWIFPPGAATIASEGTAKKLEAGLVSTRPARGAAVLGTTGNEPVIVPDAFTTIQDAIDASPDGSTILIRPGTYQETLVLAGRSLVLRSMEGAASTVIDARGLGSVFSVSAGTLTIQGFTIMNGQNSGEASTGGGVNFVASGDGQSSTLQLLDNVITANVAQYGGGISAVAEESASASLVLERNSLNGNQAFESGGGLAAGASAGSSLTLTSRDNMMADNIRGNCGTEWFLNPNGASATVEMDSSGDQLSNNSYRTQTICTHALAESRLGLELRNGQVEVHGLTSVGISSTTIGGSNSRVIVTGTEAMGERRVTDLLLGANTAGLFLGVGADASSEIDVLLEGNTISGFGLPGNGVPNAVEIASQGQATVEIRGNHFSTNEPSVRVSNTGTMDLSILANQIDLGCNALVVTNSGTLTADLTNNALVDNGSMCDIDCRGCALFVDDRGTSSFQLVNNTISGNLGPSAVYLASAGMTDVSIVNTILFGNVGRDFYNDGNRANVTISHSDVGSTFGSYTNAGGNISADPRFVDATSESCDFFGNCIPWNRNYSLTPTSPCIDAGNSTGAPSDDLRGNARPFRAAVDMGAIEYGHVTPTPSATSTATFAPTSTATPTHTPCRYPGICVDPLPSETSSHEIVVQGIILEAGWEVSIARLESDGTYRSCSQSVTSDDSGRFSGTCSLRLGQANSLAVSASGVGCPGYINFEDCDGVRLEIRQLVPTQTALPTMTPTAISTETPAHTETPTPRANETASPVVCVGDCNGDGRVTINELIRAVAIALSGSLNDCPAIDSDRNGSVTINELVVAVVNALNNCP